MFYGERGWWGLGQREISHKLCMYSFVMIIFLSRKKNEKRYILYYFFEWIISRFRLLLNFYKLLQWPDHVRISWKIIKYFYIVFIKSEIVSQYIGQLDLIIVTNLLGALQLRGICSMIILRCKYKHIVKLLCLEHFTSLDSVFSLYCLFFHFFFFMFIFFVVSPAVDTYTTQAHTITYYHPYHHVQTCIINAHSELCQWW